MPPAQKLGLHADLLENSDQNRDALNLMAEARREDATQRIGERDTQKITEGT